MEKIEDTFKHKGLRLKLIEEIKRKGIKNAKVLDAINKVPRHCFMDSSFIKFAYQDNAFPIGADQTISQPYTVAFQTELLDVNKHDKVLEIGTGSGYQTAVLLELGARVYTIERIKELHIKAQSLLKKLKYMPHFFHGDGYEGKSAYGPYDRILITAAVPNIPEKLLKQLKIGGKMVIPVGGSSSQKMKLINKTGDDEFKETNHGFFVFVPLVDGTI